MITADQCTTLTSGKEILMCVECGCGYKNGAWKYDMQSMVFDDNTKVPQGPIVISGTRDVSVDYE